MTSIKDIQLEIDGEIAIIRLNRPAKRNALSDALVLGVRDTFQNLPARCARPCSTAPATISARARPVRAEGARRRRRPAPLAHVARLPGGSAVRPRPVVAALHGAVVGGGLELAASCHIRVADATTFYALPEGSRGIFVGRAAVRASRLIGAARMADMMLTGRVYQAEEGERARLRAVPGARRPGRRQGAGAGAPRGAERAAHQLRADARAARIAEQPPTRAS